MTHPLLLRKLPHVRKCVSHAGCPDGIASAMLVKNALPDVEVLFLTHNSDEHRALRAEPGMLFTDFTPFVDQSDNPSADEVARRCAPFLDAGAIVLDHHKHQRSVVEAFGENGVFADETSEPGVAGAELAYRHVWLPLHERESRRLQRDFVTEQSRQVAWGALEGVRARAAELARLASLRDTWQVTHPDWIEATALSAALRFFPSGYWMQRARVIGLSPEEMMVGRVAVWQERERLLRQQDDVAFFYVGRSSGEADGAEGARITIALINTRRAEDLAEHLRETGVANVLVGYQFKGEDKLVLSLRSDSTLDAGLLAKSAGGGGHSRAAGCTLQLPIGPQRSPLEVPYPEGIYVRGQFWHPAWAQIGPLLLGALRWP